MRAVTSVRCSLCREGGQQHWRLQHGAPGAAGRAPCVHAGADQLTPSASSVTHVPSFRRSLCMAQRGRSSTRTPPALHLCPSFNTRL